MSFFDGILLNTIFILTFQLINIIYFTSKTSYKDNNYILELSLAITLYLMIRFNKGIYPINLLFLTVPFIISIVKKRKLFSFIIAVAEVIIMRYIFNIPFYISLTEYAIYLILFNYMYKDINSYENIINPFILLKSFFITIYYIFILRSGYMQILNIMISLIVFYFITMFTLYLLDKGEKMVRLNKIEKELEKEKKIKLSLFKITHEVKNPLSVCKGYLSMMNYKDINKVKKYNKIIESEINRTLDIMDAFSEYTKIHIKIEKTNINELIKSTIDSMKIILDKKNIKLNFDNTNKEIYLNIDSSRIKQVLVNLIKNSYEAYKTPGNIDISIKEYRRFIKIFITDYAGGMSKEVENNFKDMFYTTKENGTGVGVSLCNEIVSLHGGNLSFKIKEKVGTTAIIRLYI